MEIKSYRDLVVWKKAINLVAEVYSITEHFPKEETFGLVSQIRRAAISIPSNTAEGRLRGTRKDFRHFLLIAYGSGGELETQVEIVKLLPKLNNININRVSELLNEVMKMLNVMIKKLTANS